jgi:hypothetical protein
MAFVHSPKVVTDGLVLALDAGNVKSYASGSSTWYDKSGFGNNGTLINGPTFNTGSLGSIVFDGSNDYVDCGNRTTVQLTAAITVGCWLKASSVSSATTAAAKSNGSTRGWTVQLRGATNEWRFWINFGINVLGNGSNNGWYYASYPKNWDDGKWHQFTGIWDGSSKTVKLYIDGNQGTFNAGGNPSGESSNFSDYIGSVVIGRETDAINYYNGNASIFQIYNRALSPQEVLQNYNATKGRFGL